MGTDEKSVISHVGPWVAVMTHRFAARWPAYEEMSENNDSQEIERSLDS
jgi:hypothetical protein